MIMRKITGAVSACQVVHLSTSYQYPGQPSLELQEAFARYQATESQVFSGMFVIMLRT